MYPHTRRLRSVVVWCSSGSIRRVIVTGVAQALQYPHALRPDKQTTIIVKHTGITNYYYFGRSSENQRARDQCATHQPDTVPIFERSNNYLKFK
jgi:hypothetical protein